jgi:hypothetical protein
MAEPLGSARPRDEAALMILLHSLASIHDKKRSAVGVANQGSPRKCHIYRQYRPGLHVAEQLRLRDFKRKDLPTPLLPLNITGERLLIASTISRSAEVSTR